MKRLRSVVLLACVVLWAGAGCGHLELASAGDPNRTLTGTVTAGTVLPAGSEVSVRLIAPAAAMETPHGVAADMPVLARPAAPGAERVLGEFNQVLAAASNEPVPFRIEYVADDSALRRGLNVEARVSVAGRLRFRTINAHAVTLRSASFPQNVVVQRMDQ